MNERCVDGGESLARLLVQQSKFKHPVAWNGWCTHTYILDVPGQPYIYHTHIQGYIPQKSWIPTSRNKCHGMGSDKIQIRRARSDEDYSKHRGSSLVIRD